MRSSEGVSTERGWCCLCRGWVAGELAAHTLARHVGTSARILWQCGECAFDGTELVDVAAHCFAAQHDVARMGQSQPREIIRQLKRVQLQAAAHQAAAQQASTIATATGHTNGSLAPTVEPAASFTAEVKPGRPFNLEDLGFRSRSSPKATESTLDQVMGRGLSQPPSLKRGPPSVSGASGGSGEGEAGDLSKAPRLSSGASLVEPVGGVGLGVPVGGAGLGERLDEEVWPEPECQVTEEMEERALARSGGGLDEKSMKAFAWLLTREVYQPEVLLAGFDCVPTSLKFGKHSGSRGSAETLALQPAALRAVLAATGRRFGFDPQDGLPDETVQLRLRTVLDHLKTNRYNIRRKLTCPCGHCKKPNDVLNMTNGF